MKDNKEISNLDWALITLLQSVRSRLIDRKLTELKEKLSEIEKNLPVGDQLTRPYEHIALVHNISTALLWKGNLSEKENRKISRLCGYSNRDRNITKEGIIELKNILEGKGHNIFNSYYYMASDSFGGDGEWSLIPVVPGRSLQVIDAPTELTRSFDTYVKALRLPFNLSERREITYSSIVLPSYSGVTPHICDLKLTKKIEAPAVIDSFLADLAIIAKYEDYVQGHLSALVAPIVEHKTCFGAFLLTCSVPNIFSMSDKKTVTDTLGKVIDDWEKAPIRHLHSIQTRIKLGMKSSCDWPAVKESNIGLKDIEDEIKDLLKDSARNGILTIKGRIDDCRFSGINEEAVDLLLKSMLANGPNRAPMFIDPLAGEPGSGSAGIYIVNPEKLRRLCNDIDIATDNNSDRGRVRASSEALFYDHYVKDFLTIVFPDEERSTAGIWLDSDIVIRSKEGAFRIVVFLAKEAGSERKKVSDSVENLHRTLNETLEKQALPGVMNEKIAALNLWWLRRSRGLSQTGEIREKAGSLINGVSEIIEVPSVKGIMLLLDEELYIPRIETPGISSSFQDRYFSSPSFWLFEGLCHLMSVDEIPLELFGEDAGENRESLQLYHYLSSGNGDKESRVSIAWSDDAELNRKWACALTFLGIPLVDRQSVTLTDRDIKASVSNSGKELASIYKSYLRKLLEGGTSVQCIDRVINQGSEQDRFSVKIKIENIEIPGHKCFRHVLLIQKGNGDAEQEASILWEPILSPGMIFLGLNTTRILKDLCSTAKPEIRCWNARRGWDEFGLKDRELERIIQEKSTKLVASSGVTHDFTSQIKKQWNEDRIALFRNVAAIIGVIVGVIYAAFNIFTEQ